MNRKWKKRNNEMQIIYGLWLFLNYFYSDTTYLPTDYSFTYILLIRIFFNVLRYFSFNVIKKYVFIMYTIQLLTFRYFNEPIICVYDHIGIGFYSTNFIIIKNIVVETKLLKYCFSIKKKVVLNMRVFEWLGIWNVLVHLYLGKYPRLCCKKDSIQRDTAKKLCLFPKSVNTFTMHNIMHSKMNFKMNIILTSVKPSRCILFLQPLGLSYYI